jgi:hypothetical protein
MSSRGTLIAPSAAPDTLPITTHSTQSGSSMWRVERSAITNATNAPTTAQQIARAATIAT